MIKLGDHGNHVRKIQLCLESLGFELPRFGADGWYGEETETAASEFSIMHKVPKLKGEINDLLERSILSAKTVAEEEVIVPDFMVDCRNTSGRTASRGNKRKWSSITGITLHQTATCFLKDTDFSNPTKVSTAVLRASRVAVHHTVLRNGTVTWNNPYENEMPQAQQVFNKSDVGVEIDGWYEGVVGVDNTFWKPASQPNRKPMELTPEMVESAKETIRFIYNTIKANGGQLKHIHAHRQTSASRTSDPGEKIWKAIAIPMMNELGLDYEGPEFFVPTKEHEVRPGVWTARGPGRPIPIEWDPTAKYKYRDNPTVPKYK